MKRKYLIVFFILFIAAITIIYNIKQNNFINVNKTVKHIPVGSSVPDFLIEDVTHNTKISPKILHGNVLFINFWASWCKPCREEMDSINNLYNKMLGNKKLSMITILYKEDPVKSMKYMQEHGYTFPVYIDKTGTVPGKFGVTGVPETYIFNKQGILKHVRLGPEHWDSNEILKFITSLLNE